MEEANGGGIRTPGRSRKLLRLTENVPVAVFLPPEPVGHSGHHDGSGGNVQQHVPDSYHSASQPPETPGPQGAHSRPWARGTTGSQSPVQPHARRSASAIKRAPETRKDDDLKPY